MTVLQIVLLISMGALTAICQPNSSQEPSALPHVPPTCRVTAPPAVPFTPPTPYEQSEGERTFLLGTEKLWVVLQKSGTWGWGPPESGHERRVEPLTTKTFWASVDYDYKKEKYPELKVTGRRLDGDAPPLLTNEATNAFPGPAAGMLVGVRVPAPGCWEITGEYKRERLSFVVWVTPFNYGNQ